ncbi:unnamed protein product [Mytilus edulis]|uniref:Uncharacterized protein n=1 Tax=Mytilus edulis TaxID=6550 RepID=A0A8S3TEM0_MYTED|nr:unnamed protein product [Mytilus edulis]
MDQNADVLQGKKEHTDQLTEIEQLTEEEEITLREPTVRRHKNSNRGKIDLRGVGRNDKVGKNEFKPSKSSLAVRKGKVRDETFELTGGHGVEDNKDTKVRGAKVKTRTGGRKRKAEESAKEARTRLKDTVSSYPATYELPSRNSSNIAKTSYGIMITGNYAPMWNSAETAEE